MTWRSDSPDACLQPHKRTKKHRFAEMLAREEAGNTAVEERAAAAELPVPGVGPAKWKEGQRNAFSDVRAGRNIRV